MQLIAGRTAQAYNQRKKQPLARSDPRIRTEQLLAVLWLFVFGTFATRTDRPGGSLCGIGGVKRVWRLMASAVSPAWSDPIPAAGTGDKAVAVPQVLFCLLFWTTQKRRSARRDETLSFQCVTQKIFNSEVQVHG